MREILEILARSGVFMVLLLLLQFPLLNASKCSEINQECTAGEKPKDTSETE
jgi:hypothetical protein